MRSRRQLGAMGANDYLWQMYQKETAVDVKRQIISAMQVGGNSTRMIELAKTEKDPELRRAAVRNLGVMGSKTAGDALVELYGTEQGSRPAPHHHQLALHAGQRHRASSRSRARNRTSR